MRVRGLPYPVMGMGSPLSLARAKGGGWWRAGAALDVDFANQRAYNQKSGFLGMPQNLLTITRASGGGYYNASGVYVFDATNNALRYDYDPVTHAPLGVLIEEQRTNLLAYSEQFDTVWSNSNFTVTANAAVAPDGTTTADKLQATSTAACLMYRTIAVAGTSATFSVYVKKGSGDTDINTFGVRNSTTATNLLFVTVNYATGAISYFAPFSSGAVMTDVGNGWWRLALSVSGITSGDSITVYSGASGAPETAGKYSYMWGAQLEAGAFATSYIPTIASQVTRAEDNITLATSAFSFNATEGTVAAEADAPTTSAANLGVFALGTSASAIMRYFRQTDAQPVFQVVDTTTQATLGLGATWSSSASVKSAMAYQVDNFAASKGGAAVVTDSLGTVPSVSSLVFGSAAGIGALNGHLKRVTYWNTRRSNSELQALAA